MPIDANDFLDTIAAVSPSAPLAHKLAVVKAVSGGRATLQFEGETVTSTLFYPVIATYTPTANDRVLVAMAGFSGVILGKFV